MVYTQITATEQHDAAGVWVQFYEVALSWGYEAYPHLHRKHIGYLLNILK